MTPHTSRVLPPEATSAFCARWGVSELYMFGSASRGELRESSDLDVADTDLEADPIGSRWCCGRSSLSVRQLPTRPRPSGGAPFESVQGPECALTSTPDAFPQLRCGSKQELDLHGSNGKTTPALRTIDDARLSSAVMSPCTDLTSRPTLVPPRG